MLDSRASSLVHLAVNGLYQKIYVLKINQGFSYLLMLNVYSMDDYIIATFIYTYIESIREGFIVDSLISYDNFVMHYKRLLISVSFKRFITHVLHVLSLDWPKLMLTTTNREYMILLR